MLVAGVDEAGRGPVIGPMAVAAVVVLESKVPELIFMGVRDSKKLSPSRREELFEVILSVADEVRVVLVPPEEVGSGEVNLNDLEVRVFAGVLNSLRVKPAKVYADSADVNCERFASSIRSMLTYDTTVVAEHKADERYVVVSAASIVAKVTRDREIEKIRKEYGDVGSGYPRDPKTRKFLEEYFKEHGEFPPFVRRSWKTLKKITAKVKNRKTTLDRFLR